MRSERGTKTNRSRYAPRLEALEALRLLDAAALELVPIVAEHSTFEGAVSLAPQITQTVSWPGLVTPLGHSALAGSDAWDEALNQTVSDDWLGLVHDQGQASAVTPPVGGTGTAVLDPAFLDAGLRQLDRYLGRAWSRAGIPSSQQEDCTQAVHTVMLEELGRPGFDQMLAQVGQGGIPQVLNRESSLGPDFFRAVDMVKKRALRQRTYLAIDEQPEPAARAVGGDGAETWRGVLNDAINRSLKPREADVIRATLQGFTPAEIAEQWGLAPKTVSNEKTRALAKLREVLVAELDD